MKIGFPNNPRRDLLKEIEWIGKNKFDFVDLFLEEDMAVPEKINIEKTKKLLKKYELGVVGHTACYLPIGSPIKSLREASVKEILRYFNVFQKLGVRFVTIHSNWPGGLFSEEEGIEFQAETLRKLVKEARKFDLKVMYEPINTYADNIKNISKILKKVPGLFLNLDIGHANLFGRKPSEFIKKFHDKIRHVHLHDNTMNQDLHLPMGCGSIEWRETLKVLKKYYDGTITLEIFSDRDFVLLTKEKLRKLWNSL